MRTRQRSAVVPPTYDAYPVELFDQSAESICFIDPTEIGGDVHLHNGSLLRPVELFLGNADRPRVGRRRRPSRFIAARVTEGAAREHDERLCLGAKVAVPTAIAIQAALERSREQRNVCIRNLEVDERPRSGLTNVDVSDIGARHPVEPVAQR
jgi:hypothetical protein